MAAKKTSQPLARGCIRKLTDVLHLLVKCPLVHLAACITEVDDPVDKGLLLRTFQYLLLLVHEIPRLRFTAPALLKFVIVDVVGA